MSKLSFRPNSSHGLWLPALIPAACVFLLLNSKDTSNYMISTIISIQSCLYCYHIISMNQMLENNVDASESNDINNEVTKIENICIEKSRKFKLTSIAVSSIMLWWYGNSGITVSILTTTLLYLLQSRINHWLLVRHASTFSPGEWLMTGQCISVSISYCFYAVLTRCSTSLQYSTCKIQGFIQISVVLSALLLLTLYTQCSEDYPAASLFKFVIIMITLAVGGILIGSMVVGEILPVYLTYFLFDGGWRRPVLLIWWLWWAFFAWAFTNISTTNCSISMIRKIYHLVAVMVFISGIVFDPVILKVASVAATILCCILEVIRMKNIPPLANYLNLAFSKFLDEKDKSGSLILSPMYLLVGLSIPLWLYSIPDPLPDKFYIFYSSSLAISNDHCHSNSNTCDNFDGVNEEFNCCSVKVSVLAMLSGVLSVGIGDTFASLGGVIYGRHRWPGTMKTIEGSVFGIVAQLFVVSTLCLIGCIEASCSSGMVMWWSGIILTMVICALVEAFTDQVDNLALPLIMFCGIIFIER